jgi:hypothetical protein
MSTEVSLNMNNEAVVKCVQAIEPAEHEIQLLSAGQSKLNQTQMPEYTQG